MNPASLNTISVKFTKFEKRDGHVEYTIAIADTATKGESWTQKARYSTLRDLHTALKKQTSQPLPEFPPKRWLGNMDDTFISQRQKALENYLSVLLSNQEVSKLPALQEFLLKNRGRKSMGVTNQTGNEGNNAAGNNNGAAAPKDEPKKNDMMTAPAVRISQDPKPNKNEMALNQVVEQINQKYFDLSTTINPPEEDDVKRKKVLYEKMSIVLKGNVAGKIPVGNEKNSNYLFEQSLVNRRDGRVEDVELNIEKIQERMGNLLKAVESHAAFVNQISGPDKQERINL